MKYRVFLAAYFILITAKAQLSIPISGFQQNLLVYSPAIAGSSEGFNFSCLQKSQWNSLPGNPTYLLLTAHTPLKYQRYGVGVTVSNESFFPLNLFSANANFAYRMNAWRGKLALGINAGIVQTGTSFESLVVKDQNDDVNDNKKLYPTMGIGMTYGTSDLVIGVGIHYGPSAYTNYQSVFRLNNSFFIQKKQRLSNRLNTCPVLLLRTSKSIPTQIGISLPIEIYSTVWLGTQYRSSKTFSGMVGLNIHKLIRSKYDQITFFYYMNFASTTTYFGNAHEISLTYSVGKHPSIEKIKKIRITINPHSFD